MWYGWFMKKFDKENMISMFNGYGNVVGIQSSVWVLVSQVG